MNNFLAELNTRGPFASFNSSDSEATRIASRMDALVLFLKTCRGSDCRKAWTHLFPYGEVSSMKEALDSKYDTYFDGLPKLRYRSCEMGFNCEQIQPIYSNWTSLVTD